MLRAVNVLRYERVYFDMEVGDASATCSVSERVRARLQTFLREHSSKYLADTFTYFSNTVKSNICMICANIYKLVSVLVEVRRLWPARSLARLEVGFRRKNAFYARLAVLFRLHVDDNAFRSESDYRNVGGGCSGLDARASPLVLRCTRCCTQRSPATASPWTRRARASAATAARRLAT